MKQLLLYFLLLFSTVSSYCQEIYESPSKFITQFPFKQLTGGVILVQAHFNQIAVPLNFILDTGSGAISLDSATAAEFNIAHVPSGRTISGIAGTRQVDYTQNNTLILPGLEVKNLDFYINDYEILSSVYGEKIDGIIGYSFFRRYIVKVNFDSTRIEVFSPGAFEYPPGGTILHPLFTALPILPLAIKDSRTVMANFYFDTGAGLSFLVSRRFAEDSNFIQKKRKPVQIQVQGLGGKTQMQLTIIKEVKMGPYRFRKVPTNILDDEFNATSYPFIGGLIGDDLLRRFNLTLNYPKREIHLLPNSHFHESFDYSYTGVNLYMVNGIIYSDEVIKGSPAFKAGLKKDDIIMGVNNNFSNDLNLYKNLMQNVGQKISLIVKRDKAVHMITFRVGRIH